MLGFWKRPLVVSKSLITNSKGEILVIKRSKYIPNPGTWDLPGGIVDPGEHPKDTATRETQEETGLNLEMKLLDVGANTDHDHSVAIVYTATNTDQPVKLSHEHTEYKWVSRSEFGTVGISQKYVDAAKLLGGE